MGEEFYCILKLVSGEEIISLITIDETGDEAIIIAQSPLIMKIQYGAEGSSYIKVKSWMDLSDEDIFLIKPDKVITMTETKDQKLIDIYHDFIKDDDQDTFSTTGKIAVTSEMGLLGKVDNARIKLETIFNMKLLPPSDPKESE
jgi:hypothetical protein|tara:strand:- start:227 stop:658 length:432 start_codon:yes stop_codon:yes gene_type:complete